MNDRSTSRRTGSLIHCAKWLAAASLLSGLNVLPSAHGQGNAQAEPERRLAVGRNDSPAGHLLAREHSEKPWQVVSPGAELFSRDPLLALPGVRASVKSKEGLVELTLRGNLPQLSEYPVLESAVVLHVPAGVDLDFSLLRGRVTLTNQRDKGPVKVRVRALGSVAELTLSEPGSSAAFEVYGRMLQGTPFQVVSSPAGAAPKGRLAEPASEWACIVLKGTIELREGSLRVSMSAPPGPAAIVWSNASGLSPGPSQMDKLPAWVAANTSSAEAKAVEAGLRQLTELLKQQPADAALGALLQNAAKQPDSIRALAERSLAVFGMGAVDDVTGLVAALAEGKPEQVRELAIEALRHYVGKAAGQDQVVYQALLKKKFSAGQAAIVMQLLNGFHELQLGVPETYETLIAYVKHPQLAVRELARWHLNRLVPHSDRELIYDPAAGAAEQEKAYQDWKKLVPNGKLPRRLESRTK